jgi:lipid-A-disaccharide synthase
VTHSYPSFFLSAGEASGDHYGAQIIAELKRRHSGASFFGLGGREMEAAGQERVVRAEDVAHMGITEVIRHAPKVYGSYRRLVGSIKKRRPQAAVLIDFPDVNLRLARELKALGVPVVYFVSPQLWAWKKRRLKWVQERVNQMMVIFPFEEPFYRNRGVDARFIGHPLAELPLPSISREEFAVKYMAAHRDNPQPGSHTGKPWIALLPGSRWKEVESNLPTMLEAAALLGPDYDFLIPVANTLDKGTFSDFVFKKVLPQIQSTKSSITLVPDAREALFHARASVVASGTATVQAAVIGNPFVVVYRVSPTTFRLAKRLVSYPEEIPAQVDAAGNLPIAMVNLIAGRRIVPELLQERFTAEGVAEALRPLLGETGERARMVEDLARMRRGLVVSKRGAIAEVADAVDSLLSSAS